jgi:hypothetical protein
VKNIVLVHGAWADGSGWRGVYDNLVKDGFNVTIVQEPETSFQDDVDWSPFLRQTVKAHFSLNGELSHGIVTQAVHAGV